MADRAGVPASHAILRSLNCLRSADPGERQAGVRGLSPLLDDPRVRQVFEHLYQHDSDPTVRALAWQALSAAAPSVPGPEPHAPVSTGAAGSPQLPATAKTAVPTKAGASAQTAVSAKTAVSGARASASHRRSPDHSRAAHSGADRAVRRSKPDSTIFLLDAHHARQVARWQKNVQSASSARSSLWRWLVGALLIEIGLLWGMVLPDWVDWWALRQSGEVVQGEIIGADVRGDDGFFVYVQYPFGTVPHNLSYTAEQRVGEQDFNRLDLAAPVAVRYVPDRPDLVRLEGVSSIHTRRDILTALAAGSTALLVIGGIGSALWRRSPTRATQMLQGHVVKCQGVEADGEYTVMLRYRFRSPAGRVIVDQIGQVRNEWRGRVLPTPGTRVVIEYRSESVYHLL